MTPSPAYEVPTRLRHGTVHKSGIQLRLLQGSSISTRVYTRRIYIKEEEDDEEEEEEEKEERRVMNHGISSCKWAKGRVALGMSKKLIYFHALAV